MFVKLPMVLNTFTAGLFSALIVALAKLFTELIVSGEIFQVWGLFFVAFVLCISSVGVVNYKMTQTLMFY